MYTPIMALRGAALFALIAMALLTLMLLAGFVRDLSAFTHGVVPALRVFASLIYLFGGWA
jgi:hypothetical protein